MRFGDGLRAPRSVTNPSARTPSLAFRRLCRTVTTFARGSGPSRKNPTDVLALQTAWVVVVLLDVKMLSTLPTTRFTASRPLLQRRAALCTTLVMSTTTWSAASARPRASLAAEPNCSTSQAWNLETPILVLCTGVLREALRISYARRRRVAASQKVRIWALCAHVSHSPQMDASRSAHACYACAANPEQLFAALASPRLDT